MPPLETDPSPSVEPAQQKLAITAEVLYLVNLLLLPGLAFLMLLWLWYQRRDTSAPLAAAHLGQTVSASLWAGVLLIIVNAIILFLGGYSSINTWMVLILYFTTAHATLVLFGVIGLSKAMAGQCWRYPLLGQPLPQPCPGEAAMEAPR